MGIFCTTEAVRGRRSGSSGRSIPAPQVLGRPSTRRPHDRASPSSRSFGRSSSASRLSSLVKVNTIRANGSCVPSRLGRLSGLHFSPRGEAKWVRGPSGKGARRRTCQIASFTPRVTKHGFYVFHESRDTNHGFFRVLRPSSGEKCRLVAFVAARIAAQTSLFIAMRRAGCA